MPIATLSAKGQITLPIALRQSLGMSTGDRLAFVEVAPGRFEMLAINRPASALKGMLAGRSKALSAAEMNEAIGQGIMDNFIP